MGLISNIKLPALLISFYKPSQTEVMVPYSAQRALQRQNQPRPFNINRDAHGTRPWHTYAPGKKTSNKI